MLQTPLHRAAQSDHIQACRLLLMHGADQNIRSACGITAAQAGTENVQKVFQGVSSLLILLCFSENTSWQLTF